MSDLPIGPDLFVVTGFPTSNFSKLRSELSKPPFRKSGSFLCVPAKNHGTLYTHKYINQIENAVADHVNKKAPDHLPQRLTVIHIDDANEQLLFERCHLYASFRKLKSPSSEDWRHEVSHALAAITASLDTDRIEPYSKYSPILLPPQNFLCKKSKLNELLYAYSRGEIDASHISKQVESKCYNSDELPKVIDGGKHFICTDRRGIAFPPCKKSEAHGIARNDNRITSAHFLAGYYRFGIRYESGFHFDAQYPNKKNIRGAIFHCSMEGSITAQSKHSHANIYPNDFVRLGEK